MNELIMRNFIKSLPRTEKEMFVWLLSAFIEMTINPKSFVKLEDGNIVMKGNALSVVTGDRNYNPEKWYPVTMDLNSKEIKILVTKEVL